VTQTPIAVLSHETLATAFDADLKPEIIAERELGVCLSRLLVSNGRSIWLAVGMSAAMRVAPFDVNPEAKALVAGSWLRMSEAVCVSQ
jgi:hypothetical protein